MLIKEAFRDTNQDNKIHRVFVVFVNRNNVDDINKILPEIITRLNIFSEKHSQTDKDLSGDEIWQQLADIDWQRHNFLAKLEKEAQQ